MSKKEITTIQWDGHDLDIIEKDNERWVTVNQLAEALGYTDHRDLHKLLKRNGLEFKGKVTVVKLPTVENGRNVNRKYSIINYRGVIRVSMLARTEKAKRFRNEAEDILYKVMVEGYSIISEKDKEELREELERLKSRGQLKFAERELSDAIYKAVDGEGYKIAIVRNAGDVALFGHTTKTMKKKLGIANTKKPLADVLPRKFMAAKEWAALLTAESIKNKGLHSELVVRKEHIKHNKDAKRNLIEVGANPSKIEAAMDCVELERKHKKLRAKKRISG